MTPSDSDSLQKMRREIFLTACCGNTGHLASAFSVAEILYTLYFKGILRYDAKNPRWEGRDRLIVSKGHASLAIYEALCLAGFFSRGELRTFCRPGSAFGGEASPNEVPGVEAATGSLGHGLSYGVGAALAYKTDAKNNRVYVVVGDGECEEGSIWEAVMSAAHFGLDNLTVILDCNRLQKMDTVSRVMSIEDWHGRWEAFGWDVSETDGHDVDELEKALKAPPSAGKPKLIIAHTIKGKGVSIMENNASWHWRMPTRKELPTVLRELGITQEEYEKCSKHI